MMPKSIQFLSGSSSPEGAQTQFAAYLAEYGKNPTDYVFYIGIESFDRFFHDRYEIHCKQNPKIAESTERLRKIVDGGGKIIPAFENILPEYDKDFDDGVPF
jgi:hypothetical protein